MTSIGEISAARMTTAGTESDGREAGRLRRALTTSLTPRLSVLFLAAISQSSLA